MDVAGICEHSKNKHEYQMTKKRWSRICFQILVIIAEVNSGQHIGSQFS